MDKRVKKEQVEVAIFKRNFDCSKHLSWYGVILKWPFRVMTNPTKRGLIQAFRYESPIDMKMNFVELK